MKLLKLTTVLTASCLMAACVSAPDFNSRPEVEEFSVPPVGETVSASIGDHLIDKGRITRKTVLQLHEPITDGHRLTSGAYDLLGTDEEKQVFAANVQAGLLKDPVKYVAVFNEDPTEICMITAFNYKSSCYDKNFDIQQQTVVDNASFRQTLIYTGRVGDRLRISYREYANDTARPAFSNEVEYDLSSSNIISYRGAQIEVVDADNMQITYRVLKGFSAL